jgi:SH3 domain protein
MKKMYKFIWLIPIWCVCFFAAPVFAQTVYVADQLVITLRQGKSTQHKILKTIKTGTPMEVLESDKDDPYMKVRLQTGEEGYVLAQYISQEIPKTMIIARLEKELEQMQENIVQAEEKKKQAMSNLKDIKNEKAQKEQEMGSYAAGLDQELSKARSDLQELTADHEALLKKSQKVVEISEERDRLLGENAQVSAEVQILRDENSSLKRSGVIKWFLAGGGVFFFGWVIGKISRKRKQGLAI